MPPFTYNNSFDTIISLDSMVFNPADTGLFTTSSLIIDGCDTTFVDSVVYQRLGVQINYNINNVGSAVVTINGTVQAMPYSMNYWAGETVTVSAAMQPNWLFNQWTSYSNTLLPNISTTNISFVANASDSCVLMTYPQPPLKAFISGDIIVSKELLYVKGGIVVILIFQTKISFLPSEFNTIPSKLAASS